LESQPFAIPTARAVFSKTVVMTMPRLLYKDQVPRTPEDIVRHCKRYGVDPSQLHTIDDHWFTVITTKKAPHPRPRPNWTYSIDPIHNRYPMPPGVETFSPEYYRLMRRRQSARRRTNKLGVPLFIEGYHDLDTYVPKKDTKRHV
jgi:hypothetical protein